MRVLGLLLAAGLHGVSAARLRTAKLRRSNQSQPINPGPTEDVWLELKNFQNVQYMGDFTVGGQDMPVIYDTGSFEIIVLSDLCTHCEASSPMYSRHKSTSFGTGQNIVAKHVFGSGPVVSQKNTETVHLGTSSSPLVATQMPFWQVMDHDIDVWDKHSKFSGIIGLGHSPNTPNMEAEGKNAPVYGEDKSLLEAVGVTAFSICLERSSGTPPGWLGLGPSAENAQVDPKYRHVPVIGHIHWGVRMTKLEAGGHQSYDACDPSCGAIVDSGTSLIAAPREAMAALAPVFNKIDPDCNNLDYLPDVTFTLGADTFTIPPAIYVIKVTSFAEEKQDIMEAMFGPPKMKEMTQCVPAFMEINMRTRDYGPVWILGMPFLRYYYTVFQRNPKSLHIAYATPGCSASATSTGIYMNNQTQHSVLANNTVLANSTGSTRASAAAIAAALRTVNARDILVPDWAKRGMKALPYMESPAPNLPAEDVPMSDISGMANRILNAHNSAGTPNTSMFAPARMDNQQPYVDALGNPLGPLMFKEFPNIKDDVSLSPGASIEHERSRDNTWWASTSPTVMTADYAGAYGGTFGAGTSPLPTDSMQGQHMLLQQQKEQQLAQQQFLQADQRQLFLEQQQSLLQGQPQQQQQQQQDLFDKYECWYKTVMGAKKASNLDATERIEALVAYIDDIDSGRIEFSSEGADATKDVAELNAEIEKSTALRKKEEADFEAAKEEMELTIAALEKGLEEMEKGTEGSLLSTSTTMQKVVAVGKSMLSEADAKLLEQAIASGDDVSPDYKKLGKKRTFNKKYKMRSGKIQELIADMLQTFKDNLDEAKDKEKDAKKQYKTLKEAKEDQLEQAKNALQALGGETASREEAKAEAEGEKDDLEDQIDKDKDVMKTVTKAFEEKLDAWKARKKLMTLEVASISEALNILKSDAARDAMSVTFDKDKGGNQGTDLAFTQLASRTRRASARSNQAAAQVLRLFATKAEHGSRLRIAARKIEKEGDFDRVIEILNNVKKDLTKESKEDKDKRDECKEKLEEKTEDSQESANFIDDKSRFINRTKFEVQDLYEKVNKTVEEVEELEWDLNDATIERDRAKAAFEKEKAGLQAAIGFIKSAKKALEKFYDDNGLIQTNSVPTLLQVGSSQRLLTNRQPDLVVEAGKDAPPPPPTVVKEYKGHGGNKGIQGILQEILDDVKSDLDDLKDDEKTSVDAFKDTKKDTEGSIESKMKHKADLEDQIAGKLDDISDANEAKLGEQDTLDATVASLKAIEPSCNYVFTSFKVRIENRKLEAEGVDDAIKALGGDPKEVEHKEATEK